MGKLFLVEGVITEVQHKDIEDAQRRIVLLEKLLRESLNKTGDRAWHEKVHSALGEDAPPLRKLKGKIPRYQR